MNTRRQLAIVHPGTGTVISLDDRVFLIDLADHEDDVDMSKAALTGIRIDSANMARLFFGDPV